MLCTGKWVKKMSPAVESSTWPLNSHNWSENHPKTKQKQNEVSAVNGSDGLKRGPMSAVNDSDGLERVPVSVVNAAMVWNAALCRQ